MSRSGLPAACWRVAARGRVFRQLQFLIAAASLFFSLHFATAQSNTSWDGVWTGRWSGGAATSVTIKDGRVVEYRFQEQIINITISSTSDDKLIFNNPSMTFEYNVTRTGPAKATIQAKSIRGEISTGNLTKVDNSWDGTWSGKWAGQQGGRAAAITIVDGRVTEYLLNSVPQPIERQEVSAERVSFGNPNYIIRISRTAPTAADADYAHVSGSKLTAKLTKGSPAASDKAAAAQPAPKAKAATPTPPAASATPAQAAIDTGYSCEGLKQDCLRQGVPAQICNNYASKAERTGVWDSYPRGSERVPPQKCARK